MGTCLSLSALALPASSAIDLQQVDTNLDRAIAQIQERAAAGTATRADYQAAEDIIRQRAGLLTANPQAQTERDLLIAALNDLVDRAERSYLEAVDFNVFLGRLTDARLDNSLLTLERHARARTVTRDHYERVRNYLQQQATHAQSRFPDAVTVRDQLIVVVDLLRQRVEANQATPQVFAATMANMLNERVDRTLTDLERHARARKATREDFNQARAVLNARVAASDAETREELETIRQRLLSTLTQIEPVAIAGTVTVAQLAPIQQLVSQMQQLPGVMRPLEASTPREETR
jgi:hypothetical protein